MPNFPVHIAVSSLGSSVLAAYGTARFGWDGAIPALAFMAGSAGGMVPDLDSNISKPRRLAGGLAGLSAAVGAAGFLASSGSWLARPWSPWAIAAASGLVFILANLVFLKILKKHTRHRGLFHSLPVPFLYAGLMAALAAPRGAGTVTAVWLLALFGAFSHLVLDACGSFSLYPLKTHSKNFTASVWLWLVTLGVSVLPVLRLTGS